MTNIFLGNLSAKQMCERLGIEYTEENAEMEKCRENTCDKVHGTDTWHCYDIPLFLEVGTEKVGIKWVEILSPYSSQMKEQIRLGGWK